MKKLIFLLIILLIVFVMSGCKKVVREEYADVEVTITNSFHRGMFMTPMKVGKVTSFITHPARYEVTVEYNGETHTIDSESTYNKYKDRIGDQVIGVLRSEFYEDGSVYERIVELK